MMLAGDKPLVLPEDDCELPVGEGGGGSVHLAAADSERCKLVEGLAMYAW